MKPINISASVLMSLFWMISSASSAKPHNKPVFIYVYDSI
jgi:hypothetical protein